MANANADLIDLIGTAKAMPFQNQWQNRVFRSLERPQLPPYLRSSSLKKSRPAFMRLLSTLTLHQSSTCKWDCMMGRFEIEEEKLLYAVDG